MKVSGQLHGLVALPPGERFPDTHWIGGWMGSKAGLDSVKYRKISFLCRESNTGCAARRYTDWAIPACTRNTSKLSFYVTGNTESPREKNLAMSPAGPRTKNESAGEGQQQFTLPHVLTAVVTKSSIFWDITPRSPLKVTRRYLILFSKHNGN
jgi:hypothetical protein